MKQAKSLFTLSGIDFLLTAGGYAAMSDYLSNGNLTTAFPSVNSREVSVQIPVKFGYDFTLGEKLHFIPSVGAYGRFSMVSIKENVTENTGENSGIASNGTASTTINIIPIALMVISDGMLEA